MIFELLKTSGKPMTDITYLNHTICQMTHDNVYTVEVSDLDELMELIKIHGAAVIGQPGDEYKRIEIIDECRG